MNYQVTRIRLASVGPEPARFDPLDIDLMNAEGTGPSDSVLFLPNTGGKTVLLRLIFSVLHPPIVEKIGSEEVVGRRGNLPGYVLERDTSHIVIEWRRAEDGKFIDDESLVIGLAAEWRGGKPTGNPADLTRIWYSIRGDAETVGADRLEFETEAVADGSTVMRRIPLRSFRERLNELSKGERRGRPVVTITDVQRDWIEHLDSLGLDRALFRYQGEMNHNEAGASAIARFTKDLDFVDFFLKAVMDPAELAVLDREFEEVADKVRRYPEYERRLKFEEAALTELGPLAAEVEAATTAQSEADTARRAGMLLLSSFVGGRTAAEDRERTQRSWFRDRDAEARRLTGEADRLRDEWREYRRIGSTMTLTAAEYAFKKAQERTGAGELDVRAWSISEDIVRHGEAAAEVRVLDEAYAAEQKRLRPLQEQRDTAGQTLTRRLLADVVLAGVEEQAQQKRATQAKLRAKGARGDQRDALVEATKLDTAREANELRVADVTARRERLVAADLLASDEPAELARDRELATAQGLHDRIEAIETEVGKLDAERGRLDDADRLVAAEEAKAKEDHGMAVREIAAAEAERTRLLAEPAIVELAESEAFDLELVGPAIAARLLGRATEADAARIDIELRAIDDKRALHSLDQHGLLPPPPDVDLALERLAAAGIMGAMPGTRYVAEAIKAGGRAEVVARRADLVGGIVLTDPADLPKARSVLDHAALDPAMIVAVGPATELIEAEGSPPRGATFVVPPAPAVWDRAAAAAERKRREARMTELGTERDELDGRARGARALADELTRHTVEYPVGWLAARRAERDVLAAKVDHLAAERAARDERRQAIPGKISGLREEATTARSAARDAERRAVDLDRLAEEETATAGFTATIDRQRAEAEDWRSSAVDAGLAAEHADTEAEEASAAAAGQKAAAERIRREISTIALAEPVADLTVAEAKTLAGATDAELVDLRARFRELDRKLAGETSNSDVAARRAAAIRTRDTLAAAIAEHPLVVRDRAEALLALPEAGELAGRRAAAERADVETASARTAEQEAYSAREQASKTVNEIEEEIRSSRRRAEIPPERVPSDRHHAARLAAEARQAAEATQSKVTETERERTTAREAAEEANRLVDAFAALGTSLRMALSLVPDAPLPATDPFAADLETAQAQALKTSNRVIEGRDAADRAEKAWRLRDGRVRALLARDEFADLGASDRLYRQLMQSTPELLARKSAELVAALRASVGILRADLSTLSQDVKLATTSLSKSVNKAMSYLRLAETRSKMPASLRDWAGEPFLVIRFDRPPAEELDARLATFVSEVLNRPSNRPTGSMLLLQALERAVGSFSVRILKPNEAFAPMRVPVADLSSPTFSGGQRSTVATALMLMLSELRRQSRSSSRGASVGTLFLDNPFANANAGFLVEVQRTVAAAAGIQLVYTTGIADLNAIRHFPNVVALSNDAARRTMRKYVRANPALLELLVPPDDGPGGRLTATRVVAVAGRGSDNRG
jgi:hypothetical protein